MYEIVLALNYTYLLLAFGFGILAQQLLSNIFQDNEKKQGSTRNATFERTNSVAKDSQEVHPYLEGWKSGLKRIPFKSKRYGKEEMRNRAEKFYELMSQRRSVRFLSNDPVPQDVIKTIIQTAGTSPSGAHCQPWTFVVISNPEIKSEVRSIVEREEKENYARRMGKQWVDDLKFVGTNWSKPYLESAPYLIVVFKQMHGSQDNGVGKTNCYIKINVSIACGILITAIHNAGLVTLTSTPLNAGPELRSLLQRPPNEEVVLLLPVGFPAEDATVPDIQRKALEDIMFTFD